MTGPAVGVQTAWGCAVETTYGTPVTVDRFYEIVSESMVRKNNVIQSNGLRGGTRNLRRGSRRLIASNDAAGDVVFEVATTGFGRLFAQIMGGTPVITGAGPYTQTFAMGSVQGKSMTLQKQIRDASGSAIQTLTYKGAKVIDAEFSIAVNKLLELKLTFDAQTEDSTIGAASATYASTSLFSFAQAVLSVGGSPVANVLDATVKIGNPQDVARYFLGSAGLKAEPADSDFPMVSGTFNAEVLDGTFYGLFKADTAAALSLVFTNGASSLTIATPEIHLTGESPKVAGFGVIKEAIPFVGAYDGTDPGATITYVTSDAAA
jgi:hypothetical protein